MKKNIPWILAAVLLVALIAGASVLYHQLDDTYRAEQLATQAPSLEAQTETPSTEAPVATQTEAETEPETAPDFTVVDGQENEVSLSDFFGKPIVLNFWASWCGPCKSEMPDFDEAYLAQGKEIQFLMVNMTDGSRETLETARSFIEESGFSFPVFFDVNYDAAVTYGVSSIPTTYFIAADGTPVAYAMGAIDAETLQRGISMITETE